MSLSSEEAASIKVINNFVELAQLPALLGEVTAWNYGPYAGLQGDTRPSWHVHLCGSRNPREKATHDEVLSASPVLEQVNDLWKLIKDDLAPGYGLVRVWASGHTYGLEGTPHRYSKPSDQELIAQVHLNSEWQDAWAGETVFYDPARECISVRPRPGRLVLFDGSIVRVSRAPSQDCPTLCATLSFHMRRTIR
jgi:SM-20-related protein